MYKVRMLKLFVLIAIVYSQSSFASCAQKYWNRNTQLLLTPELSKAELKKGNNAKDMVNQYLLVAGEIVNAEGGFVSDTILKTEVIKTLRAAKIDSKKWTDETIAALMVPAVLTLDKTNELCRDGKKTGEPKLMGRKEFTEAITKQILSLKL